jgi:amino acid permease
MKQKNHLTLLEASSIVMGSGVGGGIMAVPFLASQSGFTSFILVLAAAYGFNLLIHLMLVEVMLRDGGDNQIVELIRRYVFSGRTGLIVLQILFIFLLLSFLANLSAYLQGGGEILSGLTGLPAYLTRTILYVISAAIVFFGLKNVGIFEKYALFGIVIIIVIISAGTATIPFNIELSVYGGTTAALALYGMVMYSLYSFFAVPQAVKGLSHDRKKAVKAVVLGTSFNCLLIFFFTLIAMGISRPVTEIAIIGIGSAAGKFVHSAGSLFILLAMLTSFWSISLALSDIIRERTNTGPRISWLFATLPPLLFTFTGWFSFTEFLKIAAGIVALILVFVTVPLYLRTKKTGPVKKPEWSLGGWGHPVVMTILVIMTVLMGLGSLASI